VRTDAKSYPSNLQITVKLQPTVRQIQRSPRKLTAVTTPTVRQGSIPRISRALAVAVHFQQMLERGEVRTYTDLARLAAVSKERISQLMMLNWLAPDIQDAVLRLPPTFGGRFAISETTLRRVAKRPEWGAQREMWDQLTGNGGGKER
jgi:hypothetical protein